MAEVGDRGEDPDRGQGVGGEIEERGRRAAEAREPGGIGRDGISATGRAHRRGGRRHGDAREQVARVGDRRAGQEPAEVRLHERHHVADGHRDRREDGGELPEKVGVGRGGGGCRAVAERAGDREAHEPQEHDDARHLRQGREHRGVAGARAFVHIRRVKMHRHRSEAEGCSGHCHADGHRQESHGHSVATSPQPGRDRVEPRRAADAVEAHEPVEKECRGHEREEEILEARLLPVGVGPLEGQEHVCGNRHEFEACEEQDQVVAHAHEREPGEQEQKRARLLAGAAAPHRRSAADGGRKDVARLHKRQDQAQAEHDEPHVR